MVTQEPTAVGVQDAKKTDLLQVHSQATVVDHAELLTDSEAERRLLRKLDLRIMPILFASYFLSVVDRSSVSFAKISNVEKKRNLQATANISEEQFSIALAAFFVGYILFEIPSNLALKKVVAPTWIARIMVSWGIVTTCQVLITKPWHFILLRFLLGACEAGFFPGVVYYLTFWYRKTECAKRIAGFYIATSVSGVVGSAWAYGMAQIDGQAGYYGWQLLFLTNGVPTIALGLLVYFILPAKPSDESKWLTPDERALACNRLRVTGVSDSQSKIDKREFWKVFKDYKNYLFIVMYFSVVMAANALGLFLPTILFILGYTSLDATRMSVGPYAAGVILTMGMAYLSDRTRQRSIFIMISALIGVIGFAILAGTPFADKTGKYVGCILAVGGVFSAIPLVFAWLSANIHDSTFQVTAIAFVSSVGNLGSVVASYAQYKDDKPKYVRSHMINCIGLALTVVVAAALRIIYARKNKKQHAARQDRESADGEMNRPAYVL
ncbi:major facilitator superfamily domain-containing protein [Fimicolochytrium jonesii]|uniref:major facilitator superfamily domain-containing protein n=1 Tax=Fimicolochytrium jonesii TaxID=1396493 RepID=UPI0022FE1F09|nr:major facilitator superfamily domain-containing protein [Fimicolochytrium jonesii]KAI8822843.1 major facilitator superfamily domain-containing protein [Fimicolochytrium jonesii]